MEFICQQYGCPKQAEKLCICDSKIMFCALHFLDNHQELPGNHKSIAISTEIRKCYGKVQATYQKLKKAEHLIVSKGSLMVSKIQSYIEKNLLKLTENKTEITKILKSKNSPQECLNLLEKAMTFEVIDQSLDNFEEIIKNYIRFNSNCNELEPLTIEIKKLIEDNQKMSEEISELKKALETQISPKIDFSDVSKTEQILNEKYVLILQDNTLTISSITISSDNKYVVSGSSDKIVRVWNLNKKTQKAVLKGHTDYIWCVAITSNNKYVVSGSLDSTLRVWNLNIKMQEAVLQGLILGVNSIAITSDNRYVIYGTRDINLRAWNLNNKTQEIVLKGHTLGINSVAISSDNKYVVSGSCDKTVRVWNLDNKTQEAVLQGHTDSIWCVAITTDKKYAVSGGEDKTLRVWNLNNKIQEIILQGHTDCVRSVAITSDNKYVISGSEDKTVRVWNLNNKTQEAVLEENSCKVIYAGITQDNKYAISGSSDGIVKVWDLQKYKI
jgi:WD40 repeat protein